MSSPQGTDGTRQPGSVRVTPSTAKTAGAKPGSKTGARPTAGGGGNNRRRPPVVVVKPERNWTPIWITGLVAVIALGIVAYAVFNDHQAGLTWQQKADKIPGLVDYRKKNPDILGNKYRTHVYTTVKYETSPPAYGNHNYDWQRCSGDVYGAQIANENAVHALEHGAVWVTYDPAKLSAAQVTQLGNTYVVGNDFTLMSPYPNMPTAISLQAWGFQLRLNSPTDPRIKNFIQDLRVNATLEPQAVCSAGTYVTATGTTPHNPAYVAPTPSGSAPASAPASTPASAK